MSRSREMFAIFVINNALLHAVYSTYILLLLCLDVDIFVGKVGKN